MLLARTVVRMMGRRLALRKGVAVSVAVLLLLGWGLLYLSLTRGKSADATVPSPALPVTVKETPATPNLSPRRPPVHKNRSVYPAHLRSPPPLPPNPAGRGQWGNHSIVHHLQCKFTEVTEVTGVDIQMLDVVEEIPFDNSNGGVWKQGFEISYSLDSYGDEPLNVFVVPHSHNDPGWLKTFEEYFKKQTKLILDKMVAALSSDSRRTFIWAEISYLQLWWNQAGQEMREKLRKLVDNGQLEIVTGGWVMNDEANTHYFAMIDQMIEGHSWLAHNLPDVVPQSGWAIDPFGHTPSMAYVLQRSGLTGMVLQRIHYSVKKRLAQTRELEFLWRQAWDHRGNTDMFTHMMPFYSYDIPHTCGPDPAICCQFDFKRLPGSKIKCPWKKPAQAIQDGNIKERAEMLADQYHRKAQLYVTKNLLVPLGDDFRWDSEKEIEDQFSNYQRLMDFMNSQPQMKINVQFATLSTYFTAVQSSSWVSAHTEEGDRAFPVLSGDFFTYSDRDDHYWSGYYTTRPFYKRMNRQLEARLRLAEILYSLCVARSLKIYPTLPDLLTSARRNLGLFQHHDGITGTAKDKVVVDYGKRMLAALEHADTIIQHSSQALLLGNDIVADSLHFSLGESRSSQDSLPKPAIVRLALDGPQTLLLINPLSSPSQRLVYVTVDTHSVLVTDNDNGTVSCQVNPVLGGDGSPSNDHYKLVFLASLPALGLVQYHLWPAAGSQSCSLSSLNSFHYSYQHPVFSEQQSLHESKDISLSTDTMTAVFSSHTGLLLSIARPGAEAVGVAMDIVMYGSRQGKHRSGAYLFLPDGAAGSLLTPDTRLRIAVTTGPVVHEVVSYVGVVSVQQRLGNIEGVEGKSVSVTTFTDIHQEMDKEVVMRLHSSISNDNGVFYTDLNGLQLVRRKTMSKLPLQGNVYPMPTMAFIQDSHHRLSVLGAQPQGVASLKQGWLEVFLDRRLSKDDERGLGQGIKDNKLTAAHFRILLETRAKPLTESSPQLAYPSLLSLVTMDTLLHPPHVSFTSSQSKILPHLPASLSLLSRPIPCDIFMLNLRSDLSRPKSAVILHRRGYDCTFTSTPEWCQTSNGTVELSRLFTGVTVAMATEMYLSLLLEKTAVSGGSLSVTIPPMEIQAFSLELNRQ